MSWLTSVSPFLEAALASYLTYLFTTRTRRQEFVSGQTLDAFKAIHRVLIDIRKGCQLRLAEHRQGEFEPGVWGEAPYQSPLEQLDALNGVLTENAVFLPNDSDEVFSKLTSKLQLARSFALWAAAETNPELRSQYEASLHEGSEDIIATIDECITGLHSHLGLPK